MKKLILLLGLLTLLIFTSIKSQAQVFITINPMQGHFNPGIMGNIRIEEKFGLYSNILYGDIKYTDQYGEQFKADQFKYGIGVSYKINTEFTFLLGWSSSKFYIDSENSMINMDNYIYGSVNMGGFVELPTKRKIKCLFLTDVNNWESQLGFSINLKK